MSTAPAEIPESANTPAASAATKKVVIGTLCGLLLAFLGLEVMSLLAAQKTEEQRRKVGMAGGRCETERRVPVWLSGMAGADFHTFMDDTVIVKVTLTGDQMGDQHLAKLPSLPHLHTLDLHDSQVTSAGLKTVAQWKTLRNISLANTPVTDITPLAALPQLESLQLNFSQVRREYLSGLSQLKQLTELGAGYIEVTDEGVVEIAKCPGLVNLSLAASNLGEHGLVPLHALKQLETLVLLDAKFHPQDLAALREAIPELKLPGIVK